MSRSSLIHALAEVPDPRRQGRNLKHPLGSVLGSAFVAVLGGAQGFNEIAEFVDAHRPLLEEVFDFPNGTPSHDTFRAVLMALRPQAVEEALVAWLRDRLPGEPAHLAIDGKTARGSRRGGGGGGLAGLHLVSAWATEQGLSLGQVAVGDKANEIVAIPELLAKLDLKGKAVTIDAMGCQKAIAAQVVEAGGGYLLAVKDNQPTRHAQVQAAFEAAAEADDPRLREARSEDRGRGRIDERIVQTLPAAGLAAGPEWAGLATLVMVLRVTRDAATGAELSAEFRWFISSLGADPARLGTLVRGHWGIENGLHWLLDVVFGEDRSRVADRVAVRNLALLKRLAVGLLRNNPLGKASVRSRRKRAGWDDAYMRKILNIISF